jgi:hypothetical protein
VCGTGFGCGVGWNLWGRLGHFGTLFGLVIENAAGARVRDDGYAVVGSEWPHCESPCRLLLQLGRGNVDEEIGRGGR